MSAFDAVVIGGGIVGRAAAYYLAQGGARVLVLEAGQRGRASDAGAGILAVAHQVNHPDPIQRFVARAAQHYPELIHELDEADAGPTGYRVCGRLTVAVDPGEGQELERLRQHFGETMRTPDADPALLDAAAARARFPPLREVRGAIYSRRGARVDGRLMVAALAKAAEQRGASTRPVAADRLLAPDGRIAGVVTGGETIRADHVVLAAGAWSAALAATIGLELPIAPQRGQIAHLDVDAETSDWPIVTGFGEHYMVPWDDRRIAVGATRECAGFAVRTTVEGVMEVLGEALRLAPGLATAALREVRVGLRPASADGLPIIGAAPQIHGLFIAAGHGALGLQLGPYSGKAVAELILTGAAPSDLSPFAPERFPSR